MPADTGVAQTSLADVHVIDPSTEATIRTLPTAGPEGVDAAVDAAAAALPGWSALDGQARGRYLWDVADAVQAHAGELAELESRNVGKPLVASQHEMMLVADVFRYYAGAADKHGGRTLDVAGGIALTVREPMGVVAAITPWNYPLVIAAWKVAPALACGNTVVLKPSELTPLTSLRLAELAARAGLPAGVLDVVVGDGPSTGAALVAHRRVDKVSFTGSTAVGREILRAAATTVKRVSLELGGKSASLVFADADIDQAAAAAPGAVFENAGQDCCARSRILVEASVYERFLDRLVDAAGRTTVGAPDSGADMGPLISAQHHRRVASFVEDGEDGDSILFQGPTPAPPGYWFAPTVVAGAAPGSRLAQDEIFGPVVVVMPFADEDAAVELANDTIYGLSGSIWTSDVSRAMRVAAAVRTGTVSVNSNRSVRTTMPFGGMKQSGLGRELGLEAMDAFSETKTIFVSTATA